ncbi:long-chain fatty acid--CoA ligase [Ectothiorhodospiraceae bacterium WFHF3C12]|nr:long-chain fatty acid--CoA ligase [Ectothiorhodospiraceae bacterium WFHF3C12]
MASVTPADQDQFVAQPVQDILERVAHQHAQAPAIDFMGSKLSYAQLRDRVHRFARGLQDLGVGPGVHVGLFLPNTPHYMIAFLGILRAGGTVVNYSPLDAERTLAHKIEDSRTDILVTLDFDELYPRVKPFLQTTRLRTLVVGELAEMSGQPDAVRAALQQEGRLADVADEESHVRFAELLSNSGDFQAHPVDDPGNTLAVLQYTGGTTGAPKGAVLTHGNLSCASQQMVAAFAGDLEPGRERVLAVLPPFHIYSMVVNTLFGMQLAAELYIHARFEPDTVLKAVHENRITTLPAVPTMFIAMLHQPEAAQYDLSCLKICNSGGAPLPVEVQQQFQQLTGCRLGEGWGMTETASAGTYTPMKGARPPAGSCGIAVPGVDLRIAPLDGGEDWLAPGERGEICVAGPNVMKEYWNRPDATRESMTADGFFRTGDVGYVDEDGYVFIVDRTKDMILCSGFNVYPRTIEEAIYEHEAVEEVSVIGVKDRYRGQSPMAFIKLRAGAEPFTLEALKGFLAPRLGKHEMVQAMEIREELPKTPVGKLSKKELAEEMASVEL